jgi:hypothetical protein
MHVLAIGPNLRAMKRALVVAVAVPLFAIACQSTLSTISSKVVDPLITALSRINNTAIADLQNAQKVALAATPPDADGNQCAGGVITVGTQVNAVLTAAGKSSGPLTLAELASLFQPGSAQYNAAQQVLVSACAAKAQDVLGAAGVVAAGGVIGALATANGILPLAAPAAL